MQMKKSLRQCSVSLVKLNKEIAKQKKSGKKLSLAAKEWQVTFDAMSDLVFILDKDSTILKVNKAFVKALGLPAEKIIGRKCYELMHKSDNPLPGCPFQKTKENRAVQTQEVYYSILGETFLETISPIFNAQEELIGAVHAAKDISELMKARQELERKNQQLLKLDQLKSDFVSTVSHELRTPLSITKEGINLVLDEIPGKLNPKQKYFLRAANENVDRLARIIGDLLDISQIEAERVTLRRKSVNFCDLITKIAQEFGQEAKNKGLKLNVLLPEYPVEIYVDADRMIQVLDNIVGNALKFTQKGFIEIQLQEKREEIECYISDSGVGISENDLPKVFEKFQQFRRASGAGPKGTGLGLAIVKGIIELHGGKIRVESKVGKGTKFTFVLPKYTSENLFKECVGNGIKEAKEKEKKFSLLVVALPEINKLKVELGKEGLQALLEKIEGLLQDSLRSVGDLVIKDTGEIIVLLQNCDKDSGLAVTRRLKEALGTYLEDQKLTERVKLNFGIATYPDQADVETDLIAKARHNSKMG